MGKLFDRDLSAGSPLDPLLDNMSSSGDGSLGAIACNFRCDHRVSAERQQEFENAGVTAALDTSGFETLIRSYYDNHVKTPPGPKTAFLRTANANNLVYGAAVAVPHSPGHRELVTCLDLTGLHTVFTAARDKYARPYFRDLTDPYPSTVEDSDDVFQWHARRMPDPDSPDTRNHIDELLTALAEHIDKGNNYHPVWATWWDSYTPLVSRDAPNFWLAVIGVSRCFRENRWQALLRYRVDDVGSLVRPTVLDAGWYAFHFPSPPAPSWKGGHPVNLVPERPVGLLSEFIHAQIEFSVSHWEAAGNMVAATEALPQPKAIVGDCRTEHHRLLVAFYGSNVIKWLDHPI